ncbi:MAG TPA: pirin family protein [Gemmataceae bacterium]|nr:pirin family protein [Gemmataceae bacterium]
MFTVRKGNDRGVTRLSWLDSRHTFSFGGYLDPKHHQFRALRVINDDRVAPGGGFDTHGHRDMEILTYVLSGRLEHRDSMGNGEVIRPGEWQAMTAGTGILHSEFNPSDAEPVHFLQIWVFPDRKGHTPGYRQRQFTDAEKAGKWRLVASPDGADGSLSIHQDARLSLAKLDAGQSARYELKPGRGAFLHVATGAVTVNGQKLVGGDAIAVEDEPVIEVTGEQPGEVLLFDLA